jgi:hypothetical protein
LFERLGRATGWNLGWIEIMGENIYRINHSQPDAQLNFRPKWKVRIYYKVFNRRK